MVEAKKKEELNSLSSSSVIFYMFMIPLTFSACLHYMDCKNLSIEVKAERIVVGDMSTFKYLVADFEQIRKYLPFYSENTVYQKISNTNQVFNYTFPVIGQKEMKIIKGKEENVFRSSTESVYIVIDS